MREFFDRPVLDVARDLLGAHLTVHSPEGAVTVRLTEVEAYDGAADPGSHAYRGRTARNATMFGGPGHLYVYRHLGLHHCANLVCGPDGKPSGVLLRAAEVIDGVDLARARRATSGVTRTDSDLARGPARLTVALGITRADDGADVAGEAGRILVRPRPAASSDQGPVSGAVIEAGAVPDAGLGRPIVTGPRVGVSGDGGRADLFPWRFWLDGDPTVSAYRKATPRRRADSKGAPVSPLPAP
ncbi:DNA-3-methyladenine glycosylase [Myceligenerans crystallogenes]|uniref:Putative 3-methyladenine DNA glycosylase n=1 Tax=Myceligenerans crystallogenes TaxID=316335 RepID=A0ABP4ZYV2_9MICO